MAKDNPKFQAIDQYFDEHQDAIYDNDEDSLDPDEDITEFRFDHIHDQIARAAHELKIRLTQKQRMDLTDHLFEKFYWVGT